MRLGADSVKSPSRAGALWLYAPSRTQSTPVERMKGLHLAAVGHALTPCRGGLMGYGLFSGPHGKHTQTTPGADNQGRLGPSTNHKRFYSLGNPGTSAVARAGELPVTRGLSLRFLRDLLRPAPAFAGEDQATHALWRCNDDRLGAAASIGQHLDQATLVGDPGRDRRFPVLLEEKTDHALSQVARTLRRRWLNKEHQKNRQKTGGSQKGRIMSSP